MDAKQFAAEVQELFTSALRRAAKVSNPTADSLRKVARSGRERASIDAGIALAAVEQVAVLLAKLAGVPRDAWLAQLRESWDQSGCEVRDSPAGGCN